MRADGSVPDVSLRRILEASLLAVLLTCSGSLAPPDGAAPAAAQRAEVQEVLQAAAVAAVSLAVVSLAAAATAAAHRAVARAPPGGGGPMGGGPGNCVPMGSVSPLSGCIAPSCDTGNIRFVTLSYFDGGSCALPDVVELALRKDATCSAMCSVHLTGMQTRHYFLSGTCFYWFQTLTLDLTFADGGVTGSGTSRGTGEGNCSGQATVVDAGP